MPRPSPPARHRRRARSTHDPARAISSPPRTPSSTAARRDRRRSSTTRSSAPASPRPTSSSTSTSRTASSSAAASMPPGVNNSLHLHFTAEVFIVVAGTYTFRWGRREVEGEYVGGPGDIISMPTWIFRGFSNIGGDDNFIFTILGRDDTGGLIWHPEVLRQAEGHGLHLTVDNKLIDEVAGDVRDRRRRAGRRRSPTSSSIDLRSYSIAEMRRRITTDDDRQFVDDALLCTAVPGGRARLALVIGYGMTERRDQQPRLHDPHGFNVAALRADPGEGHAAPPARRDAGAHRAQRRVGGHAQRRRSAGGPPRRSRHALGAPGSVAIDRQRLRRRRRRDHRRSTAATGAPDWSGPTTSSTRRGPRMSGPTPTAIWRRGR